MCEHLEKPLQVFDEVKRVLRAGGRAVFVTPSRYYYASVIAAMLPQGMHRFFVALAFGDQAYATFPTAYRMNTIGAVERVAKSVGLEVEKLEAVRDYPSYLMFSPLLLRIGIYYERLVAALGIRSLHACLLVTLRKTG